MKNLRQRGELALTLSLLGIFISLIGIGIGTGMSRSVQQSTSQAEADSFPFKSVLEVQEILPSGQIQTLQWENGFTWKNSYVDVVTEKIITGTGQIKDSNGLARVVWDPISTGQAVPAGIRGAKVDVELAIPSTYKVDSAFCTPAESSICKNVKYSENILTIRGISIEKGGDITYGIKVSRKGGQQPTATPTSNPTATPTQVPTATQTPNACPISGAECAPRNVKVTKVAERSIDIEWDLPQGCAGFKSGSDFWIDVERPGEYIACAAEGGSDGSSQCVLGKTEITQGRQLNTNSEEFKTRKWDENREYTVKVFTHNASPSCVSPVASTTFTYEVEAEPTEAPKKEGLSCSRGCIYSEGTKCLVGRCRADNPDCTDGIANANIGCEYAGDANTCGIPASEVDCKTGELKDKKDNRTTCEAQNGSCINEANCAAESGTLRRLLAGCTGSSVCCVLPFSSPTPKPTVTPGETETLYFTTYTGIEFYDIHRSYISIHLWNDSNTTYYEGWVDTDKKFNDTATLEAIIPKDVLNRSSRYEITFYSDSGSNFTKNPYPASNFVPILALDGGISGLKDLIKEKYILNFMELVRSVSEKGKLGNSILMERVGSINRNSSPLTIKLSGNVPGSDITLAVRLTRGAKKYGSNYIFETTVYETNVLTSYDLYRHFSIEKNGDLEIANLKIGDGVVIELSGYDIKKFDPHISGCELKMIGDHLYQCVINANIRNLTISFGKGNESQNVFPGIATSVISDYQSPMQTKNEIQTAILHLCSDRKCERVDISGNSESNPTFESDAIAKRIGSVSHAFCEITFTDLSTIGCQPIELTTSQLNFVHVYNESNNVSSRISTQSEIADIDDDGVISARDLATIIIGYGTLDGDINFDGTTNSIDLSLVTGVIGSDVVTNSPWIPSNTSN